MTVGDKYVLVAPPVTVDDGSVLSRLTAGILHMKIPANSVVTVSDVAAAVVAVRHLANGDRLPMLLDITGVAAVEKDASKAYMKSRTVTAYAMLGAGPVDRVLAHFSLGSGNPTMPVQFFTSETQALAWLEEHVQGA